MPRRLNGHRCPKHIGQIRGPQDRSRVNTDQDYEVRYWAQEFGVTEEQLRAAVQRVGSSADMVREHLRGAH